jgi:TonB family protein
MSKSTPWSWAAGRRLLACLIVAAFGGDAAAQQSGPVTDEVSHAQIAALAERLAGQLLASKKPRPFILSLTLPGDVPAPPFGDWLADQISESLAQAHPELQVISRELANTLPSSSGFFHDRNQEMTANELRAVSLGAQVIVHGNFAAIPNGLGITLLADDRLAGGNSRFEALAEIPLSAEMRARAGAALPQRPTLEGSYRASTAGIGSAICELCPAPEYTYVAQAKKRSGVVILQVWVSTTGDAENTKIVRTPDPSLGQAAMRAVRNWHFKPASDASGQLVPVVVDVAVAFRLHSKQLNASAANKKSPRID